MENPVTRKKVERKWLLLGAVIYGITLLNGLRFIRTLPSWAVAPGTAVNLFMFLGFLKIFNRRAGMASVRALTGQWILAERNPARRSSRTGLICC